ncbi:class I adenylate-forming enzyme family protein [Streptomyces abikoensis]|uniref:class I adenylate-forming enzyme family protein n=1 Tax=Streptomyces abikoensis TaxID=97398 RepID=UPI001E533867|nr:long-chain fatty acid--CoA ligase [Streptomyces abikoensis]
MYHGAATQLTGVTTGADWVDETLLSGSSDDVCLVLDHEIDRATLRRAVRDCEALLTQAGLKAGGTAALQLPPSLAYVVHLLAVWRLGVQAVLLDHRLTVPETDRALLTTAPQLLVSTTKAGGALHGFHQVDVNLTPYPGRPAETGHLLLQLSSGTAGPSKVIGRTATSLTAELGRYAQIDGMPGPGGRLIALSSLTHTYGLLGGLLHSLHNNVRFTLPARTTPTGVMDTVLAHPSPTLLMGVPAQFTLLGSVAEPPRMPQLVQAMSGGGRTCPEVADAFADRFNAPLGECYGMTETGVIATDMSGAMRPATGWAAPGMRIRVDEGELLIATAESPYLSDHIGDHPTGRWANGWLRTRDAGEINDITGLITVRGRLDSQVSVRGLKVDLSEVEDTLTALPGVREAVVLYGDGINAYVEVEGATTLDGIKEALGRQLADFKLPRRWYVMPQLPRTATGKPLHDHKALRAAAQRNGYTR